MKKAFTMIEMVFVKVVLGILASIAIPKMAATRTDAQITKGRADVASIRSAIVTERQSRLIQGQTGWITKLHNTTATYFDGNGTSTLLMYGIVPKDANGHWYGYALSGTNHTYKFKLEGADNIFTYNPSDGTFKCTSGARCTELAD